MVSRGNLSYITADGNIVIVEEDVREVLVANAKILYASSCDMETIMCRIGAKNCLIDISKGGNGIIGQDISTNLYEPN